MEKVKTRKRRVQKKALVSSDNKVRFIGFAVLLVVLLSGMYAGNKSTVVDKQECWDTYVSEPYSYMQINKCTGETKQGNFEGTKKFLEWQSLRSKPKTIS